MTAGLLEGLSEAKVLDEVPELLFLFRWNLLGTSHHISARSGSSQTCSQMPILGLGLGLMLPPPPPIDWSQFPSPWATPPTAKKHRKIDQSHHTFGRGKGARWLSKRLVRRMFNNLHACSTCEKTYGGSCMRLCICCVQEVPF